MKEKTKHLVNEFLTETVSNAQFYHKTDSAEYHPRYMAAAKSFSYFINRLEQLPGYGEHDTLHLLVKSHRKNYWSQGTHTIIGDWAWLLRQFELQLFGSDRAFQAVYQQLQSQVGAVTLPYRPGTAPERHLAYVLGEFNALGVVFDRYDIWQVAGTDYLVVGPFAQSDLWLQPVDDRDRLVRLLELMPLQLGDFHKMGSYQKAEAKT